MKRVAWLLLVVLAALNLTLAIRDFASAGTMFGSGKTLIKAHDFLLRRNEAACLLKGIDPYRVWTEEVKLEPYYPYVKGELRSERVNEPINAYTPWQYPYAMIYAALPKQASWILHTFLMLLSLFAVVCFSFRLGGPWAAVAALLFVIPANVDINVGNYALIVTAAVVGMVCSLEKGKAILSALCWVVVMFKPQLGVLLSVPLLMKGRWRVCFAAGAVCVLLSIPPAVLCGVSPVTLIREAPAASAHAFEGCALMPKQLLLATEGVVAPEALMAVAMTLGLVFCVWLTWRVRKSDNWLVLAAPSLLCSVCWTYVQPHSYVMLMLVSALLVADMAKTPTLVRFLLGVPAILLMARFARGAEIVTGMVLPALAPIAAHLTSLSATIAFALTTAYFLRYFKTDGAHGQSAFGLLWQKS